MKKIFLIGCGGLLGFGLLAVIIFGLSLYNFYQKHATLDEEVKAQYTFNKSDYDKMWKSFREMAQVTDMQADDMKKVYTDVISGRYKNSDKVFVQMIQEQNPQMNTDMYSKLMRNIQDSRNTFNNNQKTMVDKVREYNTFVRKAVFMNMIFHYKTLNPDKYIITSERTDKAFKSGKDDEINLRGE